MILSIVAKHMVLLQHVFLKIVTISPNHSYRMQECVQTFDKKLSILEECAQTFDNNLRIIEDSQKMSRMDTQLPVLAVWGHTSEFGIVSVVLYTHLLCFCEEFVEFAYLRPQVLCGWKAPNA